jgi:hypothetical protein
MNGSGGSLMASMSATIDPTLPASSRPTSRHSAEGAISSSRSVALTCSAR